MSKPSLSIITITTLLSLSSLTNVGLADDKTTTPNTMQACFDKKVKAEKHYPPTWILGGKGIRFSPAIQIVGAFDGRFPGDTMEYLTVRLQLYSNGSCHVYDTDITGQIQASNDYLAGLNVIYIGVYGLDKKNAKLVEGRIKKDFVDNIYDRVKELPEKRYGLSVYIQIDEDQHGNPHRYWDGKLNNWYRTNDKYIAETEGQPTTFIKCSLTAPVNKACETTFLFAQGGHLLVRARFNSKYLADWKNIQKAVRQYITSITYRYLQDT